MAVNVDYLVRNCKSCARNDPKYRLQCHMHLFTAIGLLQFVAMGIVGLFSQTVQGNQNIFVRTDRYLKSTRAVSTLKTTAMHVANVFMKHRLISYGIPTYLMAESRTQFVSKFFATVCALL